MINGIGNGIGFSRVEGTGGTPVDRPIASPATNIQSTAFQANWQLYPGAVSYELDVSTDPYFGTYVYKSLSTTDTFFGVVGLTLNQTYYYRVRGIMNGGGVSLNSNVIMAVTSLTIPFTFTVDTTQSGVSASDQFQLPLVNDGNTLDALVDWGDGTSDTITTYNQAETLHTYPSGGTYTIKISGDISGWQFNNGGDKLKMGEIQKWGVFNISVDAGFYGCYNMTCSATDIPIISSTSLRRYFRDTIFNGAIGSWDTSSIDNMTQVFAEATSFNQDIGSWDTSSVTNMNYMFRNSTSFNQDIGSWDITQVSHLLSFMQSVTLSTTNYNALLIGWEATLQSAYPSGVGYPYTISISFGSSKYTLLSAAATARASLVTNFGWTITDGGGI